MVQSWKSIAYWSLLFMELSPSEKSAQEPNLWIAITHWILPPISVTKEANSDHQIQESHWLETKIFWLTPRPILLNVENNGSFLSYHQIKQFHWSKSFFFTPTHKPIQYPLYISTLILCPTVCAPAIRPGQKWQQTILKIKVSCKQW